MALRKWLLGALLAASMTVGCKPKNWPDEFVKIAKDEYKMTQEMADTGLAVKLRSRYMKIEEKDGKKLMVPNYGRVTLDQQIENQKSLQGTLNELLDQKDKGMEKWRDYAEKRGVLKRWERREEAVDFRLRRLRRVKVFQEFMNAMGYSSPDLTEVSKIAGQYSISLYYPDNKIEDKTKIDPEYVKNALTKERLEMVDTFVKLLEKKPNPAYPNKDMLEQYIWKEVNKGFRMESYDVDMDKQIDYIYVFRKNDKGDLEKLPALAVYKSLRSNTPDVCTIDIDKEGSNGYGYPDAIARVSGVTNGYDFLKNNEGLVKAMFIDLVKHERERSPESEMKVYVVKYGELENLLWETETKNGFKVPYNYKNEKDDNFRLGYEYKKAEEGKQPKFFEAREIDYFVKKYDVAQRVVEAYKLKPEFKGKKFYNVMVLDNNFVEVETDTGMIARYRLNSLIEEKPFRVEFDYGKYRDTIEDRDGKEPVYEARKRVIQPKELRDAELKDKQK
jgi:hypothetical protein